MDGRPLENCAMIVFGGTGDLFYRKLAPAVYHLCHENKLPEHFALIGIGRRAKTTEQYQGEIRDAITTRLGAELDPLACTLLSQRVFYYQMDFLDEAAYPALKEYLASTCDERGIAFNYLFYLAVAPEYFGTVAANLNATKLARQEGCYRRLVIEKPFGRDLDSARKLNEEITEVFHEDNVYRIDHYLGKEMLQNITVLRFANPFFEPMWNNQYIDHIQIISSETLGVGMRAGYYDSSGALKDMMQNHMLQLLTMTMMEPPAGLDSQSIRDEKIKLLKSIRKWDDTTLERYVIRGQYTAGTIDGEAVPAYRTEENINPLSDTETYVALRIEVNNYRWSGVPVYIRTGKRIGQDTTQVVVQFKHSPYSLYTESEVAENYLVIKIQPDDGISLQFNIKKPGTESGILPVTMDFQATIGMQFNSPEAYERLLFDVMRGDSTLFTRWDEVEAAWRFIDAIKAYWGRENPQLHFYPAGSHGPTAVRKLFESDGRKMWEVA